MTPADIKAARAKAGLTQAAAAKLARYSSQSRWAEIESGVRNMDEVRWRYFLHVTGLKRIPFGKLKTPRVV